MKKQERAEIVRRRLGQLYPDPPIPLDHHDDFTLLVAVLLSAATTLPALVACLRAAVADAIAQDRQLYLGGAGHLDSSGPRAVFGGSRS